MITTQIIENQAQIIELLERRLRIVSGVEKVQNKGLELLSIFAQISSLKMSIKSAFQIPTNPD